MGAGKTAVMAEASDILAARGVRHAAIDLDALGMVHGASVAETHRVVDSNLRCMWRNFASLGVTRLLLARAIETREELEGICEAVGGVQAVVCRLTASLGAMQRRVRERETGMLQEQLVDRVAVLEEILDRARLEDFAVVNENRAISDVAAEVLARAGW